MAIKERFALLCSPSKLKVTSQRNVTRVHVLELYRLCTFHLPCACMVYHQKGLGCRLQRCVCALNDSHMKPSTEAILPLWVFPKWLTGGKSNPITELVSLSLRARPCLLWGPWLDDLILKVRWIGLPAAGNKWEGQSEAAARRESFGRFGKMKPESEEDEWVASQAENICFKKKD